MKSIIDPRRGDIEDDASSTKQRSILSLAGSMFAEISFPKLIFSWIAIFAIPGLFLGLTPLIISAWGHLVTTKIGSLLIGIWPAIILIGLAAVALYGARWLYYLAESSFWSLNSVAIEPAYTACREVIRHLAEKYLRPRITSRSRLASLHAATALLAGLLMCLFAALLALMAWPASLWIGTIADMASPWKIASVALANGVVLVCAYLAVASLLWSVADAIMPSPQDLAIENFASADGRQWRVAHLSDIHVVGERYGFRMESGRSGAQGNERLARVFALLDKIDMENPLDFILITGDMTDAGRSAEWAELGDVMNRHPRLLQRTLILPGNHDLNIVDRANPARLELPMSPNRRLRRLRFLAFAEALQGERVRTIDYSNRRLGPTLSQLMAPHRDTMVRFMDAARPRFCKALDELWVAAFPMVVPPQEPDGLGVILLNSNADTHFSFTNALGLITIDEMRGIEVAAENYPRARWIVALHHHVVEYPSAAKQLSERIGTALVNGNWFIRRLKPLSRRAILMHGHRHTDWIGQCASVTIVSAPSPVMEATNERDTYFYIQTLGVNAAGNLQLLEPDKVVVAGKVHAAYDAISSSEGPIRDVLPDL